LSRSPFLFWWRWQSGLRGSFRGAAKRLAVYIFYNFLRFDPIRHSFVLELG
jgi:hypothetical protein